MIDRKTVQHIADLARLEIADDLADRFSMEMTAILNYFDQLEKIDTKGVQPLLNPTEIVPHFREDVARGSLEAEETVANAPQKVGNLFRVPPVV